MPFGGTARAQYRHTHRPQCNLNPRLALASAQYHTIGVSNIVIDRSTSYKTILSHHTLVIRDIVEAWNGCLWFYAIRHDGKYE